MDEERRSRAISIPIPKRDAAKSRNSGDNSKAKSTFELAKMQHRMDALAIQEQPRRRSRSAPLSLEATGVAKELRQAGEMFQTRYQELKTTIKRRRRTVGANNDKRLSWPAWDSHIPEEDSEDEIVFDYSSSLPNPGTSV